MEFDEIPEEIPDYHNHTIPPENRWSRIPPEDRASIAQRLLDHRATPEELREANYPLEEDNETIPTPEPHTMLTNPHPVTVLAQLVAVDILTGDVIVDVLVKTPQHVVNYHTEKSGLKKESFTEARKMGKLVKSVNAARKRLFK
ncbi:hypothetical protein BJX66DRAFT_333950 [Aspergillus keveii]|uniref:Uncharacterized protein n=1 Tax=Aspergillus keveii TaxID=714993 RepID=A0ABR4GJ91_9EURO